MSCASIVTLDRQDRGQWDTREIAEGVRILQSALAAQRTGRYQVEAAIAALHDDAASADETDGPQILAWYDALVALTDDPVRKDPPRCSGARLPSATSSARPPGRTRPTGCATCSAGATAGMLRADAAHRATDIAERDDLVRQAVRARQAACQDA